MSKGENERGENERERGLDEKRREELIDSIPESDDGGDIT